ncbi:MAG: DNA repair protein RadC [Zetaproteobacteria bacterium]|nr:DNA repair protein RadC [Zetaproteobacteria bacterium]
MVDESVQGHRLRLKARFQKSGFLGFHDYEKIELLLTYTLARKDVKPIAKRLMALFGNLAGVLDAPIHELQQVEGVGEQCALFLTMLRALEVEHLQSKVIGRSVFNHPDIVKDHLRLWLQGRRTECFGAIFTDQQHHCLLTEIIFEGTIDRTAVYPRELLKRALIEDAKGMILFHNHPGGSTQASEADLELTRRVVEASALLDMRVLDHFIVAGDQVVSFKEKGWF